MSRHRSAPDSVIVPDRSPVDRIAVLRPERRSVGWVPGDGPDVSGWSPSGWDVTAPVVLDMPPGQPPPDPRRGVSDGFAADNPSPDADRAAVGGSPGDRPDFGGEASGWSDADADPDADADADTDANTDLDDADDADDAESGEIGADGVAGSGRARRLRLGPRWHRLAETWVPEPMRDARIDPGRRGALILSLVAALAAVAAAIGVWRDQPQPRPVQPVASAPLSGNVLDSAGRPEAKSGTGPGAGSDTGLGTGGSAGAGTMVVAAPASATGSGPPPTSAGPAVIAVSVTGLVNTPGLVELPAGSRVADAVAAAGGVADGGSVTGLNLAAPLSDGDSVVVGATESGPPSAAGPVGGAPAGGAGGGQADAGAGGSDPAGAAPVNLNTADADTLETLPGVGPVMAGNILAWREQNGSFSSIEQLQEVSGIGPSRFAQLQPLVTIG